MDMTEAQSSVSLGRYAAILGSRWPIIVIATAVGLLGGALYTLVAPTDYVASAKVEVTPITTDPFAGGGPSLNTLEVATEAVAASSSTVITSAAEATEGWDALALQQATTVTAAVDSAVITISVRGSSEQRARDGADAVAEAYLATRSEEASARIARANEANQEQLNQLRGEFNEASERAAAAEENSAAAAKAEAERRVLELQIGAVLGQASDFDGIETTGGELVAPAQLSPVVVQPSRQVVLASGAALGLGIGIVLAFAIPLWRRRVGDPRDVRRDLDAVVLGGWSDPATAER